MTFERFCLKFFTQSGSRFDDAIFIDIFHEWIRLKKLGGILLDVADYRHVPDGPGIMLITHEVNFAIDHAEGRDGLFAQRKRGQGLTFQERLLELARATVACGALLESDWRSGGKVKLKGGGFHFMSNDRLAVPNTGKAFSSLLPDLQSAAGAIYPDRKVSISKLDNDPRDRLTIVVDAGSVSMSELAQTLAVTA